MDPKILVIVDMILALAQRMSAFSGLVQAARNENRPLNDVEWKAITDADDSADVRLEVAVLRAKSEGR